jgi:hypothetical protein
MVGVSKGFALLGMQARALVSRKVVQRARFARASTTT